MNEDHMNQHENGLLIHNMNRSHGNFFHLSTASQQGNKVVPISTHLLLLFNNNFEITIFQIIK